MKNNISWTRRCEDGVKREIRVLGTAHHMKWQFKRADEEQWDYDSEPTTEEWDTLEEILERRVNRGHGIGMLKNVRKLRSRANA